MTMHDPMRPHDHLTDDDLVLHFYREDAGDTARRVAAHLDACAPCRAAWDELRSTLRLVDQADVPEPPAGFERVVWARLQPALAPAPRRWSIRVLAPLAATMIVSAIAGGYLWRVIPSGSGASGGAAIDRPAGPATRPPEPAGRSPAFARPRSTLGERVLLAALDDHFEQAQMLLVELNNAPATARDVDFERDIADDLVASGRLYRAAAWHQGNRQLVSVLDDLEAVLVEVARRRTPAPADLDAVRARIAAEDLLFKVRASTRQIHDRQRELLAAIANE
jgi:hypothetical protein